MFDKVRLWWKYEGRYYHKDFIQGIKNLWKWFPTIWKDRDWDHSFIYTILAKKIENQAKCIGSNDRHMSAARDVEIMLLCVRLIKIQQEDLYGMEYMDYINKEYEFVPTDETKKWHTIEDTVIEDNLDEYFKTMHSKYNEDKFDEIVEYINTIIHKFYKNGIKLVFLTFPDKTVDKTEIYIKINDYLKSINVPFLDISNTFDNNINEILRDGIHTTPYGSEEYARLINDYFHNVDITIPEVYPSETKYCVIKKLDINSVVNDYIIFNGPCEIIGISQIIGPYTGLLDIDGTIINNWDRWCYYERNMVNLRFKVSEETIVKILQDDFDRSLCDNNCDWSINKYLKLQTIYYINGELNLINYE